MKAKTNASLPADRFVLRWHERVSRSGTGPKQLLVGSEAFRPSDLDCLMVAAHEHVKAGYLITITPPSAIAVDAS